MNWPISVLLMAAMLVTTNSKSQDSPLGGSQDRPANQTSPDGFRGPLKDASFQLLWLVESDDQNRQPYEGPAREGLRNAGFTRLVQAGSAWTSVTIGQKTMTSGVSRYGPMKVSTCMLNTTEKNELQINIELQTSTNTPINVDTTVRVPLDRWFLLAAADSRVGLPLHAADGKRSVLIMRIVEGVTLLD